MLIVAVCIGVIGTILSQAANSADPSSIQKYEVMESQSEEPSESLQPEETETESSIDSHVNVGQTVDVDGLIITFVAAESYESDNEFIEPKEGYEFWKLDFSFENTSDSDKSVSSMMDWDGYADNTKIDQTWIGDENGLDATLSPGRNTQGSIYFEVPIDAESIEIEYETNMWSEEKIVFVAK